MATTGPKPVPKAPPKGGPQAAPVVEAVEEEVVPVKKSRKKPILFVSIGLLLLGVGGMGIWYFMDQSKDAPAPVEGTEQVKKEDAKPPVFIVLDPFTVNLQADGAGEQFLQISFTVQVADEKQVDLIKLYMPQIRSRLLMLLSSKKASELISVEGKKKLSEDIVAQIKLPFTPQGAPQEVSAVFFTSFVVQ